MLPDLTPSRRPHGAQRMLSSTTLTVEALVAFFAALVSHQLNPADRLPVWSLSLVTALLLVACAGMLRKRGWPYVLGAVLQIPMILLGIWVPAMWIVGILFAALYVFGVLKGHTLDAQKDAVDARYWAAHPEDAPSASTGD
ncbi:DUF4233 domain-containing protein [Brachybacterium endophyticum]|uniref:DUF4233 domain-containing protein n=1 Tax=Brachybacterium endophyticum TaxID=2182385 RepID=A0A2U2RLF6_9MICO|nr:DUF4233 domain-containing protein [Brachybacterium endophyticum]PWH06707.1 DUF4233 domain-containing protein [Brachybacterium endophyticum]